MPLIRAVILVFACLSSAQAEPMVLTDIAPVQSLAARVMEGVGEPGLLVEGGADAHDFALRPSQRSALARADLVIWAGDGMVPWLRPVLGNRPNLDLSALVGITNRRPMFDTEFSADPHLWLDPANAAEMATAMAAALAQIDPRNAATYEANMTGLLADLKALNDNIAKTLAAHPDVSIIVQHDAYAHFAGRFGIAIVASLADSEARAPGAARLLAIRTLVASGQANCLLAEPIANRASIDSLADDTGLPVVVGDPEGSGLQPGPTLYFDLMMAISQSIADCDLSE